MSDLLVRGVGAGLTGLDAAVGNVATDPSAKNLFGLGRDVLIENSARRTKELTLMSTMAKV